MCCHDGLFGLPSEEGPDACSAVGQRAASSKASMKGRWRLARRRHRGMRNIYIDELVVALFMSVTAAIHTSNY